MNTNDLTRMASEFDHIITAPVRRTAEDLAVVDFMAFHEMNGEVYLDMTEHDQRDANICFKIAAGYTTAREVTDVYTWALDELPPSALRGLSGAGVRHHKVGP